MSTSPLFAYERFLNALSSILAKAEAHCNTAFAARVMSLLEETPAGGEA